MANYDMNGVPFAAEAAAVFRPQETVNGGGTERTVRLHIDAALKDMDGRYLAELVQQGFSEIAVTTGGKVYEY